MPTIPPSPPSEPTPNGTGFGALALDPRLLEAIEALGFDEPTPVQEKAIPPLLEGRDLIGRARTGSGKTAAFGLPLLEKVKDGGAARALVLAPTRELAMQVGEAMRSFAKRIKGVRTVTVYGGAPYPPQLKALKSGATVVVGTPGRLIDHLERGSLDLSGVEYVVLDEADEMLRMGFIEEVEKLLAATPPTRQVALFSATMPSAIRNVARKHLNDPLELQVEGRALTVENVEQQWICVPERFKLDALVRVLRGMARDSTLVFARTRAGCAEVADALAKRGLAVEALHGDLSQPARERVVQGLRSQRLQIVIATDVAARGIDVDHISHVINFDLPPDTESYIHRIGRTARAGRKGTAISFVTPRAIGRLERLKRELGVAIDAVDVPTDADIARLERGHLKAVVKQAAETRSLEGATALLEEALGEGPFELESLAAAALQLLADRERVSLSEVPAEGPPGWARRRETRKRDSPRSAPPPRRDGPDETQETALFIPLGFARGVRPGDIVGLLTNEAQISPNSIGRITILSHKSFVNVSRATAQQVMQVMPQAKLRGVIIPIKIAYPRGSEPERDRPKPRPRPSNKGKRPAPKPTAHRKHKPTSHNNDKPTPGKKNKPAPGKKNKPRRK